jgi:hypothetical protein
MGKAYIKCGKLKLFDKNVFKTYREDYIQTSHQINIKTYHYMNKDTLKIQISIFCSFFHH